MNNNDIPVWEKYTLTIEEASKYFRIGENKLRRLAEENKDAGWLIMNGNRIPASAISGATPPSSGSVKTAETGRSIPRRSF